MTPQAMTSKKTPNTLKVFGDGLPCVTVAAVIDALRAGSVTAGIGGGSETSATSPGFRGWADSGCGRSSSHSPQKRHLIAVARICSLQNGQALNSGPSMNGNSYQTDGLPQDFPIARTKVCSTIFQK